MAAGLGFKDFTTGEVLTAADVDGYLMQGVWVFASAAARDAAVTSPQEGNFAYLKDTNVTTYYTGSAWANLDTTGMTNPMTTTGDTIYSSSGSTPARLGIGTAGQLLRVNSGATAPEWYTPAAAGGITLISDTQASANSSIAFSSLGSYSQLLLVWNGLYYSGNGEFGLRFNNDSSSIYNTKVGYQESGDDAPYQNNATSVFPAKCLFGNNVTSTTSVQTSSGWIAIDNYTSTTRFKPFRGSSGSRDGQYSVLEWKDFNGTYDSTNAITSLDIIQLASSPTLTNIANTSIRLYGIS